MDEHRIDRYSFFHFNPVVPLQTRLHSRVLFCFEKSWAGLPDMLVWAVAVVGGTAPRCRSMECVRCEWYLLLIWDGFVPLTYIWWGRNWHRHTWRQAWEPGLVMALQCLGMQYRKPPHPPLLPFNVTILPPSPAPTPTHCCQKIKHQRSLVSPCTTSPPLLPIAASLSFSFSAFFHLISMVFHSFSVIWSVCSSLHPPPTPFFPLH